MGLGKKPQLLRFFTTINHLTPCQPFQVPCFYTCCLILLSAKNRQGLPCSSIYFHAMPCSRTPEMPTVSLLYRHSRCCLRLLPPARPSLICVLTELNHFTLMGYGLPCPCLRLAIPVTRHHSRLGSECIGSILFTWILPPLVNKRFMAHSNSR